METTVKRPSISEQLCRNIVGWSMIIFGSLLPIAGAASMIYGIVVVRQDYNANEMSWTPYTWAVFGLVVGGLLVTLGLVYVAAGTCFCASMIMTRKKVCDCTCCCPGMNV
jgi:hypothetical protein